MSSLLEMLRRSASSLSRSSVESRTAVLSGTFLSSANRLPLPTLLPPHCGVGYMVTMRNASRKTRHNERAARCAAQNRRVSTALEPVLCCGSWLDWQHKVSCGNKDLRHNKAHCEGQNGALS